MMRQLCCISCISPGAAGEQDMLLHCPSITAGTPHSLLLWKALVKREACTSLCITAAAYMHQASAADFTREYLSCRCHSIV